MEKTEVVLLADAPEALTKVCGITLMERLLRTLQRLGFRHATVISKTPELIAAELAKPSWARAQLAVEIAAEIPVNVERALVVPANLYCDARLLIALRTRSKSTQLVDANPPAFTGSLVQNPCGPRLQIGAIDRSANLPDHDIDKIDILDASEVDDYIVGMRRHLRPVCVVADRDVAAVERIILDSAQKGTLDIPAYVHAPIEKAITAFLCKTPVTPNQITLFGFALGVSAIVEFATGRLGPALLTALIFGVVDGLDGKQARVKVETTERGEWEHHLDFVIENAWWIAMAFWLHRSGELPTAYYFLALLFGSYVVDTLSKQRAKRVTGRLIDDVAPFDRAFRLIGARRNVYIWMLAASYLFGAFRGGYMAICFWAAVTAVVHVVRSVAICRSHKHRREPLGS